jgi:hypothetical protein
MSEWWTYEPSNFLLFAPRTYYRLIEQYHAAIWPAQLVALVVGIAILALAHGEWRWRGRAIAAILAVCWAWVALAFHFQRYATINWAATWFAAAFMLEALLLIAVGVIGDRLRFAATSDPIAHAGLALVLLGLFVQPLLGPLAGRNWSQAEIFGITPDPTAVVTLGLLLRASRPVDARLALIPLSWCAVGGAFLWTMRSPETALVLGAGLVGLLALAVRRPRGSG